MTVITFKTKKMIKIYHNPRCRKSREGLQILEDSGKEFKIIKYLDEIPTEKELSYIIKLLNINPIDLVRKNESIWKDNYNNKELTDKNSILNNKELKLIENHLNKLNLTRNINKFFSLKDLNKLLFFIKKDKKNTTKKVSLVLLKKIGFPIYKLQFDEKKINLFFRKELIK